VDPAYDGKAAEPRLIGDCAALAPLAGPAVLVTAVAPDALRLRRVLDEARAIL
jgi:urease accessory protein